MKSTKRVTVRRALRDLGLEPTSRGGADGLDRWVDRNGRVVRAVLRRPDLKQGDVYALALELKRRGIADRGTFLRLLGAGHHGRI